MRMKTTAIGWCVLAVILTTGSAQAVELTNRDKIVHNIVVLEGQVRREISIAPDQTLTDLCKADCNIWVGNDPDAYELVATDKLIIENAQLYFVEPPSDLEPNNQAPNGGTETPSAPSQ